MFKRVCLLLLPALAGLGCQSETESARPITAGSGTSAVTDHERLWDEATAAGFKAADNADLSQEESLARAEKHFSAALDHARKLHRPGVELYSSLNNLAWIYVKQDRPDEAEALFKESIQILQTQIRGEQELAAIQQNLAQLYFKQRKFEEARPLYKHAYVVFQHFKQRDAEVSCLLDLARIESAESSLEDAENYYKLALAAFDPGSRDDPGVVEVLEPYAKLLRRMKREEEAARLESRVVAIRGKQKAN